jgi:hypothetical protein
MPMSPPPDVARPLAFVRRMMAIAVLAAVPAHAHAAATCKAASGQATVPLVELYTSEGCDSCPPADRWLSAQFPPGKGEANVSVLAFHVDYWDRLGWKDRFASPAYTARQYDAMRSTGATFVYTPQVLVQGRDAEVGRANRAAALVAAARARPPRASLALDLASRDEAHLEARVTARVPDPTARHSAVVWLAYTQSGLVSDVKAGENRGVRLVHDHVVRALAGPYPVGAGGEVSATARFDRPAEPGRNDVVVAVVQDTASGEVLQTLTQPRCGGD